MSILPKLADDVADAIDSTAASQRLRAIRNLIFETAEQTQTTPIAETLKWGQPAYLPPKKDGTTIRLGATDTHTALYVHCQTTLVDQFRDHFPTEFVYEGNRAVLIPHDTPIDSDALSQVIALALTYHRRKRGKV